MWQNIISACHTQRRSCKNGEWKWRRRGRGTRRQRRSCVVVNAADNPAHHLQQQLQRELLVADQHTNAILKNHPKPVGNIWRKSQEKRWLALSDWLGWLCRGTCWFYPGCLSIWLSAVDCRWWLQLCVARCSLLVACCSLSVVAGVFVCLFWCVLSVGKWSCFADCLPAWQRLHVACLPGNIWCFNDKICAIDFSGVSNSLSSESVTASRHLQWQPVFGEPQHIRCGAKTCHMHQARQARQGAHLGRLTTGSMG